MKKKIYFLLVFILSFGGLSAQDELDDFLLPDFENGAAMMKSGNANSAPFNYNIVNEEMTFLDQENNILALTNVDRVVYIKIGNRTFEPAKGTAFYEKITTDNGDYYIQWKGKIESKGTHIGYGIYEKGGASKSITKIQNSDGDVVDNRVDTRRTEEEFDKTVSATYYVKVNDKFERIKSLKDLTKIYKSHKAEIETFAKDEKINFKKRSDVAKIIDYCLALTK